MKELLEKDNFTIDEILERASESEELTYMLLTLKHNNFILPHEKYGCETNAYDQNTGYYLKLEKPLKGIHTYARK